MPEIYDKLAKLFQESLGKQFEIQLWGHSDSDRTTGHMIIVHFRWPGSSAEIKANLPIAYIKLSGDCLSLLLFDKSCDWGMFINEPTNEPWPPPDGLADYGWSLGDPKFDPVVVISEEIRKISERISPRWHGATLGDLFKELK